MHESTANSMSSANSLRTERSLQVAETFSQDQAPAAHRRLEAGGVRGRLVLEF
ncbi:hypothetical protein [Brevibacterium antiquum]|uniref:hypothetical protein n=1 Tax=Brevibacterium antiquum TaxID=234835 RepID=UPI0018DF47A0|nr:hypothetical protein [Brevibacterium antiquum]